MLDATELKRKCARFVADHAEAIAKAEPEMPAGLTNRSADIWEPLLALADLAGGGWPKLAREAAAGLTARAKEYSPIGSLLLDIFIPSMDTFRRYIPKSEVDALKADLAERTVHGGGEKGEGQVVPVAKP